MAIIECCLLLDMMLALVIMYVEMRKMNMKLMIYMNELAILITEQQMGSCGEDGGDDGDAGDEGDEDHEASARRLGDMFLSTSEDEEFLEDQHTPDLDNDQLERRSMYRNNRASRLDSRLEGNEMNISNDWCNPEKKQWGQGWLINQGCPGLLLRGDMGSWGVPFVSYPNGWFFKGF